MIQSANISQPHIHFLYNMNKIKLFEKLEEGIDFNAQNSDGNTVLHLIAQDPKKNDFLQHIIDKGIDFSIKNNTEKTALEVAIESGNKVAQAAIEEKKEQKKQKEAKQILSQKESTPTTIEKNTQNIILKTLYYAVAYTAIAYICFKSIPSLSIVAGALLALLGIILINHLYNDINPPNNIIEHGPTTTLAASELKTNNHINKPNNIIKPSPTTKSATKELESSAQTRYNLRSSVKTPQPSSKNK